MHEFRPLARPSKVRALLAGVLTVATMAPVVALVLVMVGIGTVAYRVHEGALTIDSGDRFWGARAVPLAALRDVRALTLRGGRRTAGTALPGYCVGRFHYPDLGDVWQATSCHARVVVVRAEGQTLPLVLSPPDADGFIARLRDGEEATVTLPPPDKGPLFVVMAILLPFLALTDAMLVALLLVGPSRMRYLVGDGALEVRTLFGHKRWSLAGATAKAHAPARLWRVAGAAMPGYVTGLYREGGNTVRVYATDVKGPMVLVEVDGARVLLSPESHEGFLAALHAEGAGKGT